jgi:hypothetical protein
MRSRQALETHLNRHSDLMGTQERISTKGPSGMLGTTAILLGQSMPPGASCNLQSGGSSSRIEGMRTRGEIEKCRGDEWRSYRPPEMVGIDDRGAGGRRPQKTKNC